MHQVNPMIFHFKNYVSTRRRLYFPHPSNADKHGIVAYGGDLNPLRILEAYKLGIFPWFESDQNLMWWSPDPRMILHTDKFKVSKVLRLF